MSEGSWSDEQVHIWLQEVADAGWIALHFDSPALGGVGKSEISGGGYARVKMPFSQPANRAIWSLEDARFTGLTQGQITHFSIWDSAVKGMMRAYALLPSRAVILEGRGHVIPAGDLSLSIG